MSRETVICPLCRRSIWSGSGDPVIGRATVSSRASHSDTASAFAILMQQAEMAHQEKLAKVEAACVEHFQADHGMRYRIAQRLGWEGLMKKKWPWSRVPNFEEFEVES